MTIAVGDVTVACRKCPQDCPCLRECAHVVCVFFSPRKAILSYTKRKPPIDFYFKELSKPFEIDKKRDFVFTKPPQMMLTFIDSVYVSRNRTFGVLLYRWALSSTIRLFISSLTLYLLLNEYCQTLLNESYTDETD